MTLTIRNSVLGKLLLLPFVTPVFAQTIATDIPVDQANYRARYGQAEMNISCNTPAHIPFEKGLLQLHSFAWQSARENFQEASRIDPECAMAYWGEAMTYYDGLHEQPSAADVASARSALARARSARTRDQREAAYIAAAEELFKGYPGIERIERDMNYSLAMEEIYRMYPQDHEAAIFYSLSILSLGRRGFDNETVLERVTAILEPLLDILPEHPGVAHYLIHVYDDAGVQERGLVPARRYSAIAPVLTHPQHMPAHIFAGMGMWKESNLSNQTALQADPEYFHALMYLVYGHLQLGQQTKARELTEQLRTLALSAEGSRAQRRGLHAVNTWLLLETRDWNTAADVPVYSDAALDVAETLYLRGLGAAHIGNMDKANAALDSLNNIISELSQSNDSDITVRTQLMQIHARQVEALIRVAENRGDEAINIMREAVQIADQPSVNRAAPDSGTGLPAHEVFGEILLALGHFAEAQQEFTQALRSTPNRLHSIAGLARAAAAARNSFVAEQQYRTLLELLAEADEGLPELKEAQNYLAQEQATN
jgi:tetratricopeptide (TPR) repeat protein